MSVADYSVDYEVEVKSTPGLKEAPVMTEPPIEAPTNGSRSSSNTMEEPSMIEPPSNRSQQPGTSYVLSADASAARLRRKNSRGMQRRMSGTAGNSTITDSPKKPAALPGFSSMNRKMDRGMAPITGIVAPPSGPDDFGLEQPQHGMSRKMGRGTAPMRSTAGPPSNGMPADLVVAPPDPDLLMMNNDSSLLENDSSIHEPSVREPSVHEPSLGEPEEDDFVRPPLVSVNSVRRGRAEARAQRKLRASARSHSPGIIAASTAPRSMDEPGSATSFSSSSDSRILGKMQAEMTPIASNLKTAPVAPDSDVVASEEPEGPSAMIMPGTATSISASSNSRVSRKIRGSMTPASNLKTAPISLADSGVVAPEEPEGPSAMIVPGTVTSVSASSDSRVSRKIRGSMTPASNLKTAPISLADSGVVAPEEPSAMIMPGTVTSVSASSDSRVSRKIRGSMTPASNLKTAPISLADSGVVATEEPEGPSAMIMPGTVTSIAASNNSRVARKLRGAKPGAVSATASQDASVQRKMSNNRTTTISAGGGLAAVAAETFDDEPEGPAQPGTAVASSNFQSSRAARKIAQAQAGVGASASMDDSAVSRKSGRSRGGGMKIGGAAAGATVGAVQATGDDPAAQKHKTWVQDNLFSNDEGSAINPDDYLQQQVKATQQAQSKKMSKKKEKKDGDGLHKDGVAAVPKAPGAFSVKGGRGWFTGGFRQRAPMLMQVRRQQVVQDGGISEAAQDVVDEDEDCWDRVDKPTLYVGICIVIFIIIAVTVPVSLVRNEEPAPTPSPTSARFFILDEFQTVFSDISDPTSFEDPRSPQSQALNWMVYDDGLALSPNDESATQRYISMLIYFANGGEGWQSSQSEKAWGSSIPECQWDYVTCTSNQTIGELNFLGVGLTGTLEAEMLNLTELSSLDLADNNFREAQFPSMLLQMTNLVELFLDTNAFHGSIPSEISNLVKLEKLIMGSNDFTGTLPIEMRSMTSLISFQTPLNRLEGNVFNVITGWPNLKTLDIGNNDFFGTIPTQLGLQRNLAKMSLERNDFRGSLPTELGDLINLRSLVVNQNFRLNGALPSELARCEKLEQLQFNSNNFVGTIPAEYGNLVSLRTLRFQQNELTGELPSELGLLTNLESLDCSNNEFNAQVPSELGELSLLGELHLQFTDVTGTMPEEICALRNGGALASLIAMCLFTNSQIQCERPECCTSCR